MSWLPLRRLSVRLQKLLGLWRVRWLRGLLGLLRVLGLLPLVLDQTR
jgi:hypothetical protein